ncbi:hypothetical protein F1643_10525 [Azospirillum sp. INR13]|uniref:hypothetical protein n=1 Tax=Azospirillum sp. INR13 TaxID=2596919 RepID=UPI00189213CD|nr:hypothetical protein [Azospirillum sp. INR13]MBF5094853.1 hypothetical protein [Azospirillum sp. INR13]
MSIADSLPADARFGLAAWLLVPVRTGLPGEAAAPPVGWTALADGAAGPAWGTPDDQARFFLGGLRRRLGLDHGRRWRMEAVPPTELRCGDAAAALRVVDLLALDEWGFLLLRVEVAGLLTADEVLRFNRALPAWIPRTVSERLPDWHVGDGVMPLSGVVRRLLPMGVEPAEELDWFGHDVPLILMVTRDAAAGVEPDALTAALLAGLPPARPDYTLAVPEQERLVGNTMAVWRNWLVGQHGARTLFYAAGETPLTVNIDRYYHLLVVLTALQQVRLWDFMERLAGLPDAGIGSEGLDLRRELAEFRRIYMPPKASTYPIGDRLYRFFMDRAAVDELASTINRDIAERDKVEQLMGQRRESAILTALTAIASLAVPATTVATILQLDLEKLGSPLHFWGPATIATALAVGIVVVSWLRSGAPKR